jgi:hypothetical protein
MVSIDFDKQNEEKIVIVPEAKDHIEQIITFSVFLITLCLISIIFTLRDNAFPNYMLIWICISLLALLYFIFPNSKHVFDFSQNFWYSHKKAIFIPFARKAGKISNIELFVIIEEVNRFSKKKKFQIDKTQYFSALELWEDVGETTEPFKNQLFSRKTFNLKSHEREMDNITQIIKFLRTVYNKHNIPFAVDYQRDSIN